MWQRDAASYLGVTERTIRRWRCQIGKRGAIMAREMALYCAIASMNKRQRTAALTHYAKTGLLPGEPPPRRSNAWRLG